jgi:hypothetical protein
MLATISAMLQPMVCMTPAESGGDWCNTEVKSLHSYLRAVKFEVKANGSLIDRSTRRQQHEVRGLVRDCESFLVELEQSLSKYKSLKSSNPRVTDKLRFTSGKQSDIEKRIASHGTRLDRFLTSLQIRSLARIEEHNEDQAIFNQKVIERFNNLKEEVRTGKRDPSIFTDQNGWLALEKELLEDDDVTEIDVEESSDITRWLEDIRANGGVVKPQYDVADEERYVNDGEAAPTHHDPPSRDPLNPSPSHSERHNSDVADQPSNIENGIKQSYERLHIPHPKDKLSCQDTIKQTQPTMVVTALSSPSSGESEHGSTTPISCDGLERGIRPGGASVQTENDTNATRNSTGHHQLGQLPEDIDTAKPSIVEEVVQEISVTEESKDVSYVTKPLLVSVEKLFSGSVIGTDILRKGEDGCDERLPLDVVIRRSHTNGSRLYFLNKGNSVNGVFQNLVLVVEAISLILHGLNPPF